MANANIRHEVFCFKMCIRDRGKQALLCAGHRQADRSGSRRIGGAPAAEGVSDRTWTG